ncbi:hypothetical protein A1O3_03277 [Capronia epimyces CBS 606.96]|uniref:Uncharacterized protein n=1 Tax=Capronia epimyces CBS 606.96 TaxID=1182542 RepID=W9YAN4_9EURO|nr:uncharacterized protein A1O3_03277 [Capronia epimyces CBS 606.96]EXJ86326.1 hypothetical protein A1O3_03277 [Capronia epimyces CBS 606.96]
MRQKIRSPATTKSADTFLLDLPFMSFTIYPRRDPALPDRPSLRKRKKRRSCTSEFDYEGWKEWGEWRRNVLQTMENPRLLKGCDYCDYPSQCRSLADIQTLTELAMSTSNTTPRATGAIEGETPNSSSTETGGPEQSVDPLISSAGTPAKERSGKPSNAHPKQPEKNKTAKCSKQAVVARKDRHVVLIPSLQEEMAKEAMKLRELIDMDVWGDLEGKDVDGDIRMIA